MAGLAERYCRAPLQRAEAYTSRERKPRMPAFGQGEGPRFCQLGPGGRLGGSRSEGLAGGLAERVPASCVMRPPCHAGLAFRQVLRFCVTGSWV